jgi:hypothetical protein
MGTRRKLAEANKVAEAGMPVCVAEAPRPDPAAEEGRKLREEARRALQRFAAHAAVHGQTYYLGRARTL